MFKIGDFSRLTQVTVKALRHYDRLGLLAPESIDPASGYRYYSGAQVPRLNRILAPESIDPASGYRYYSGAQVPRLNRILALKDLGFSLEQIGQLLDADLSPAQLQGMLLVKRDEVRGALAAEEVRLEQIEDRLRGLGALPDYRVTIRQIPVQRVAAIRATLPHYGAIGALFGELSDYQRRHRLHNATFMAIWHDGEYREAEVDTEAALVGPGTLPTDGRIQPRDLPAVPEMACATHHGPLATVGAAHIALLGWIEERNYRIAGPTRTIPRRFIGPESEQMVMEIQYPVTRDTGGTHGTAA